MLRAISIRNWAMIANAHIDLTSPVTILAGPNGSGKTTILRLIAHHANWRFPELVIEDERSEPNVPESQAFGHFEYEDGSSANLERGRQKGGIQHSIFVRRAQQFPCLYIPSHRVAPAYAPVAAEDVAAPNARDALERVDKALQDEAFGRRREQNALHVIKRVILDWSASKGTVEGGLLAKFAANLKRSFPQEVGLRSLEPRNHEIVVHTTGNDFTLESLSGGLASLALVVWQLTMFSEGLANGRGLVIIDEPENHLHAAMQRRILPDLVSIFPGLKFVVATHSPLIVGSVKGERVYVLRFSKGRRASASDLGQLLNAGTAADVLHDALGVPFSGPIWAEKKIAQILRRSRTRQTDLQAISKELEEAGLERWALEAVLKQLRSRA